VVPAQIVALIPAFTVAAGLIVNSIASVAMEHGPAGSFEVIVNVTVPVVISLSEGVYVAVARFTSSNVPLPLLLHVREDAPPPTEPDKVYAFPEQITALLLASAVATGLIAIVLLAVTIGHPFAAAIVLVTVYDPLVLAVRFTKPEAELILKAAGAEKIPATPPPVNVGKGLVPF
jgi:hypothetical protein